ncbi:MAG: hypothetical protein KIT68_00010 [Phycisphaeraceae bacterium]|nr:hypothetical protein [Phycisphaeraceae bacterium]
MPRNRSAQTDSSRPRGLTILVTAGPTHEPIDSVRYIANRSSGKMGIAIADAAARRGHRTTLLLGPARVEPTDSRVTVRRFRSTADLQALLGRLMPRTTILIMAAAVADYRPRTGPAARRAGGKLRRRSSGLTLRLEPTPDLLAECARRRRPGQVLVGFALEPQSRLLASARRKLVRKGVDLIVANPLETMDSPSISAWLVGPDGKAERVGPTSKLAFARQLVAHVETLTRSGAAADRGRIHRATYGSR